MKGILTEQELNEALKKTDIAFRDEAKAKEALKLYLVDGLSSSLAMEQTGIDRRKITAAADIILDQWRKMMAQQNTIK